MVLDGAKTKQARGLDTAQVIAAVEGDIKRGR